MTARLLRGLTSWLGTRGDSRSSPLSLARLPLAPLPASAGACCSPGGRPSGERRCCSACGSRSALATAAAAAACRFQCFRYADVCLCGVEVHKEPQDHRSVNILTGISYSSAC